MEKLLNELIEKFGEEAGEEIYEKMIGSINKPYGESSFWDYPRSAIDTLLAGFVWRDSEDGHYYWVEIYEKMREMDNV